MFIDRHDSSKNNSPASLFFVFSGRKKKNSTASRANKIIKCVCDAKPHSKLTAFISEKSGKNSTGKNHLSPAAFRTTRHSWKTVSRYKTYEV